jgi:ornithine cyclodeaminase/alanine dehydrogenase-like protein (mu-crystallin family)
MNPETLVITGDDVRAVLGVEDCIAAVETAFRRHAEGAASPPAALGVHVAGGGFHVKAAALALGRPYFAAKLNGNFPGNPARSGLPTIQGIVALCDADNGRLLALLDSIEITRLRTGAATAVAAKHLARPEASVLTVFGCGRQGRIQVECLARVLRLARVYAHDCDPGAADGLARWAGDTLGLSAAALDAAAALRQARESDVIVTCTPARRYYLTREAVSPGCFVAAVGADDAGKQELEPELLAASTLVVDVLEQCAAIGELHHALAAGVLRRADVYAELWEVVGGARRGRRDADEIVVFDSTGTALTDVAAAAMTYERALTEGRGVPVRLAGSGAG